jgi:hypothetical protein
MIIIIISTNKVVVRAYLILKIIGEEIGNDEVYIVISNVNVGNREDLEIK